jgi:hypothetical protein
MARGDRSAVALLMACSALLGAAVYFSSPARADGEIDDAESFYVGLNGQTVCEVIGEYPSPPGVMGVLQAIVEDTGWDTGSGVDVINASVATFCPEYWGVLVATREAARSGSVA